MSPRAFQARCLLLCSVLVTGLSLLSVRLIQIQVWERQKFGELAHATYDRSEILPGLRGKIVDRHEEVLAKSIALSTVMVDAKLLADPVVVVKALALEQASRDPKWETLTPEQRVRLVKSARSALLEELPTDVIVSKHLARAVGILARPLGLRKEELRRRIEEPMGRDKPLLYFPIVKDLPEDSADQLRELIEENQLKGFRFENSIKRWYTSEDLAVHVVGYTGEEESVGPKGRKAFRQIGKFGVEAAMEEYLRGKDGVWDHLNVPMPGEEGTMVPPVHGFNVQLTIDMGIQAIIEEELDAGLAEYESERGCIVVLDPKTGELLGMVNRPSFNLNTKENIIRGGVNFALQGIYEPGSTFKIVCASAALNEKLVTPNTMIYCENGSYAEGRMRPITDSHPYGMLSVEGVLFKSSNIGSFKLARQVGVKRFYDYVHAFGFGEKTGILLSDESSGIARNSGNYVDFSRAAFGYALSVTPLQVAAAYGVVANGGELIQPRVVRSIIAGDGTVLERFEPAVVRRVLSEDTAAKMRAAFAKVTEKGGTATLAAVPGYKVGGKTGTAHKVRPDGRGYLPNKTVSFAGIFPAEDPAFVCVVVIDDPRVDESKVRHFGGTIAAPIFSKLAARIATHMNLTPTEPVKDELATATP